MKDASFLDAISKSLGSKPAKSPKKEQPITGENPVPGVEVKLEGVQPETEVLPRAAVETSRARAGKAKYKILTVSLFENDIHAIGAIRERLQSVLRSDTINRSDAVKVATRYALEADAAVLARIYREVKAEDGRFKSSR